MEINYWLIYREKNYPTTAIFSEQDEATIQNHLVALFKKEMTSESFFTLLSDINLWRILSWWAKSPQYKKTLKAFLDEKGRSRLSNGHNRKYMTSQHHLFLPFINISHKMACSFTRIEVVKMQKILPKV